jgi:flagellar basal-body rod modification protein FlgD
MAPRMPPEHAMTIAATSATTPTTPAAVVAASTATTSSGLTSTDFMSLLVSELQNQNPLDPTDSTDFINQLTSYANFDQQQTLNTNLNALATSFNSLLTLNSANYIGHSVTAKADSATLQNGAIGFGYSLDSAAASVTLTVSDASGNAVWTGSGGTDAGSNSFAWDGKSSDGTQLPDGGTYSLTVSATDSSGNAISGYTSVSGTVTGVDSSSGSTMLLIGKTPVAASSIIGVTS